MKPRISLFSTSYKQKEFLRGYFDNILSLEDWDKCELVLVRPKTFDEEENEIYSEYSNIKNFTFITLEHDLGLYGCWNHAIKLCKSDFVSNANTDDRRAIDCIPNSIKAIEKGADLIYSDYNVCQDKKLLDYPFLCDTRSVLPEFTLGGLIKYCLPGSAPVWNKKFFGQAQFRTDLMSAGDLHFWLYMYKNGAKFKKLNELTSTYYFNPAGQSTDKAKAHKKSNIEFQVKSQFAKQFMYSGELSGKFDDIWIKK